VTGGLACVAWGVAGLLTPAVLNLEDGRPVQAVAEAAVE
jgi:hypothetical protein